MKIKQTIYSLEHMLPDTFLFQSILQDAGLTDSYRDEKDGRTVYKVKEMPRSFRSAFIEFEESEG